MTTNSVLDAFSALMETWDLGQPLGAPQLSPDGEGQLLRCERGLATYHPDLGAAPIPVGFADAWLSQQGGGSSLGYPLSIPKPWPGKAKAQWQEYENGVLFAAGKKPVQRLEPLPLGGGSLSEDDLTRLAGEWLHRLAGGRSEVTVTQEPALISLLDFRLEGDELLPRGHAFQFQALYRQPPFPAAEVRVTCEIRWSAATGTNELTGWLDAYDYQVDLPTGWSWVIRRETLDAAVDNLVRPWLRKPQVLAEAPQPLLCAKVLTDGALHAFAARGG